MLGDTECTDPLLYVQASMSENTSATPLLFLTPTAGPSRRRRPPVARKRKPNLTGYAERLRCKSIVKLATWKTYADTGCELPANIVVNGWSADDSNDESSEWTSVGKTLHQFVTQQMEAQLQRQKRERQALSDQVKYTEQLLQEKTQLEKKLDEALDKCESLYTKADSCRIVIGKLQRSMNSFAVASKEERHLCAICGSSVCEIALPNCLHWLCSRCFQKCTKTELKHLSKASCPLCRELIFAVPGSPRKTGSSPGGVVSELDLGLIGTSE